jgi:hypothetical protein
MDKYHYFKKGRGVTGTIRLILISLAFLAVAWWVGRML